MSWGLASRRRSSFSWESPSSSSSSHTCSKCLSGNQGSLCRFFISYQLIVQWTFSCSNMRLYPQANPRWPEEPEHPCHQWTCSRCSYTQTTSWPVWNIIWFPRQYFLQCLYIHCQTGITSRNVFNTSPLWHLLNMDKIYLIKVFPFTSAAWFWQFQTVFLLLRMSSFHAGIQKIKGKIFLCRNIIE